MFKIFELQNNQPVVTTEGILTFKNLFDRDTTKDKGVFFQEMEFIYFYTDYKSYYSNLSEKDRESSIIKDYIKIPNWKPDNLIKDSIEKYKALQQTQSLGLLIDARDAVDKIRLYYKSIDFNKVDIKGQAKFKITEVTRSLADLAKIIESLDKLTDRVKKEEELNSKTRGEGEGGYFEDR